MDYFKQLEALLRIEKEEDRRSYRQLTATLSVQERRENGMSWYPVAIKDTELGRGDYLTVEVERTTHQDIVHQLRFGMSAALFSNQDAQTDRVEGTISYISGNRLKLSLRTDELPERARKGKLGIDAVFDENSYAEMEAALRLAPVVAEKREEGRLTRILTGKEAGGFQPASMLTGFLVNGAWGIGTALFLALLLKLLANRRAFGDDRNPPF